MVICYVDQGKNEWQLAEMMLDESSEVFAIEAERMWNFDDVRGDIAVDNIIVAVGQCDGINSMYYMYLSYKLLPPILEKILPTPSDLIFFAIFYFLEHLVIQILRINCVFLTFSFLPRHDFSWW